MSLEMPSPSGNDSERSGNSQEKFEMTREMQARAHEAYVEMFRDQGVQSLAGLGVREMLSDEADTLASEAKS